MNILLLSPATNNIGETYTLGEVAKELIREGNKCWFIAPSLAKTICKTWAFNVDDILACSRIHDQKEANDNNSAFIDFIKESPPRLAIIADWHEYLGDGISNNNSWKTI